MKRTMVSAIALMVASSAAIAADVTNYPTYPVADQQRSADPDWTGLYVGGRIGYGNANHDLSVHKLEYDGFTELGNLDGLNSHGLIGGFKLGADFQIGNRLVVGLFGTYDFTDMRTELNINQGQGFQATLEKGDEWSLGGRVGALANPETLVYIQAAYTRTEYDVNFNDQNVLTTDYDGVSIGGGVEFLVAQNMTLGIDYMHTFYGEETVFENERFQIKNNLDEDKVMLELKYKLNQGLFN